MKTEILTKNQRSVLEQAKSLGELFYEGVSSELSFKPRLYPLLAGPTGSGKSFLVEKLAKNLNATYIKMTFGGWLPQGVEAERGGATIYRVLDALWSGKRVLLHLDELDKLRVNFNQAWERAIANEIWNVLDKTLPIDDWVMARKESEFLPKKDTEPKDYNEVVCQHNINSNLWIVGSGTWQHLFQTGREEQIGFGENANAHYLVEAGDVFAAKTINIELLARFNSDLLILNYPESEQEKIQLLKDSGISALAKKLGTKIDPAAIDFSKSGLRELETLACKLLVQEKNNRPRNYFSFKK